MNEERIARALRLRRRAIPPRDSDAPEELRLRREKWPALFAKIDAAQRSVVALENRLKGKVSRRRRRRLEEQLEEARDRLEEVRQDPRGHERLLWRFASDEDQQLHDALSEIERRRERFDRTITDVEQRANFARRITERSVTSAQDAWNRCASSLGSDPRFKGVALRPQVGLVPLGRDTQSGLHEFWHVGSGQRPEREGTFARGTVRITEESGIVLVLLPGGAFWMGAQKSDSDSPNHDPQASSDVRPVHRVTLAPFFMGKHEVTQAQWRRLMGTNPAYYAAGAKFGGQRITPRNPVEQVSWTEAKTFLHRLDLLLPTEAQWEYATRAGTTTPWWTGASSDSLDGVVNLRDTTFAKAFPTGEKPTLTDGFTSHAPVGALPANGFGLHEVAGNVREWCRDRKGAYGRPVRSGDGLRLTPPGRLRVHRGGSFFVPASYCRSAPRTAFAEVNSSYGLGLRASRALR